MLKKLLLTTALVAGLAAPASAAVVGDLGVNPTSSQGDFSNGALPTGAFADQWTFQLTNFNSFFTIGSATNVYPQLADFITNFSGSVYQIVGAVDLIPGTGNDQLVLGPANATPGNCGDGCQVFGGSAGESPEPGRSGARAR